jgi:hypothetical protein
MRQLSLYVDQRGRCFAHFSGFSLLAAFVPVIWALQRRLYGTAVIVLLYSAAVPMLFTAVGENAALVLYGLQIVVLGTQANRFHQLLLEKRGWIRTEEETVTKADSA